MDQTSLPTHVFNCIVLFIDPLIYQESLAQRNHKEMSRRPSLSPPRSNAEAELDELEDDFQSDEDDASVFKIRQPLKRASAVLLTTRQLHGL